MVTSRDLQVNIFKSIVASPRSVTIDPGREGTPSRQVSFSHPISVAVAHVWNTLCGVRTAKRRALEIIFPCEFAMSSSYQNVEETEM